MPGLAYVDPRPAVLPLAYEAGSHYLSASEASNWVFTRHILALKAEIGRSRICLPCDEGDYTGLYQDRLGRSIHYLLENAYTTSLVKNLCPNKA